MATKPPAKKAPARASTRKPTSKWIRNLHNCVVHVRVGKHKDPEHLNLEPRGTSGDTLAVDAQFTNDGSFVAGIGTLFEVITETEARDLQASYPSRGYRPHGEVQMVRPEDTEIMIAPDWDGEGRRPDLVQKHPTGMITTDVPGADAGLHAQIQEAEDRNAALPPEAKKPQRVVLERASGQDNRASLGK